jgi:hypothetical protein
MNQTIYVLRRLSKDLDFDGNEKTVSHLKAAASYIEHIETERVEFLSGKHTTLGHDGRSGGRQLGTFAVLKGKL